MIDRNLAILGSTGSVGKQAVEIAEHLNIKVDLLTARSSVDTIESQARKLRPKCCVLADKRSADILKYRLSDTEIKVYSGEQSCLSAIEESHANIAVNAVSGFSGLLPAMSCAKSGKRIAMSNKEAIVIAYKFLKEEILKNKSELIPVDSEHSAIFQCLQGKKENPIKRIVLTSSGGPFRGKKINEIAKFNANDALAHPTWKMGAKITIDSATLMNKGFEVIEAVRLFEVKPEQVDVVVHPESIMHSAVEYNDNSVIAQLGAPDMRTCIQYAITYPSREKSLAKSLDFATISKLSFEKPDYDTFKLLSLAYFAIKEDGLIPAVLNASDEVAVRSFLNNEISLLQLFDIVENVVKGFKNIINPSLDEIIASDHEARILTEKAIAKVK
ncbi:MAG: 1-deoxy-D-xylulose-5-phosphate reductoisomerase [Clostridia bacterium]|nr:1-deoxy-D-xylulose-5-phosphate reductoisomerase [Clostridia bacterium]